MFVKVGKFIFNLDEIREAHEDDDKDYTAVRYKDGKQVSYRVPFSEFITALNNARKLQ